MTKFSSLVLLAIQLASFATANVSTYSQSRCFTRLTTKKPGSVPTTTQAHTLTFKPRVTTVVTATRTIIPPSTTVTTVATSTSSTTTVLTQVTDTYTSTATITETDTTTTTVVSTESDTVTATTTVTSTSTVAPSAGFTPLASQLAAEGYTVAKKKKKRSEKVRARHAEPEGALEERGAPAPAGPKCIGGPSKYPAAVSCTKLVEIVSTSTITSTARNTRTVTAKRGTVTQTSTTVVTTTLTSTPVDASTTLTASATTTITSTATASSTTTTTLTTTSTSYLPIATFYSVCDTNNLVSSINGEVIANAEAPYGVSTTTSDSAYDCCVQCAQSSTCAASIFLYKYSYGSADICYLLDGSGTCSGSTSVGQLLVSESTGAEFTASNGNCGQFSLGS